MKLIRKFQFFIALVSSLFVLSAPVLVLASSHTPPATPAPGPVAGSNYAAVCEGVGLTGGDCSKDAEPAINGIVKAVINVFSAIVGVAAVIMILIGGFKYITSSGDSNSINGAKNTILYALVGLVVVALAQIIVQFTLRRATAPATPAGVCAAPTPNGTFPNCTP